MVMSLMEISVSVCGDFLFHLVPVSLRPLSDLAWQLDVRRDSECCVDYHGVMIRYPGDDSDVLNQ